jgi:hypothetical protein
VEPVLYRLYRDRRASKPARVTGGAGTDLPEKWTEEVVSGKIKQRESV